MQTIYMQSDENFEVFTTVFSPQVCRSRMRNRPDEVEKVVTVTSYKPQSSDELPVSQGDVIHVLFKEDQGWWYGRLQNGTEGYFPASCVGGTSSKEEPCKAIPHLIRRGSVPLNALANAVSSRTGGRITPKLPRKDSLLKALGHDTSSAPGMPSTPNPPNLLHRVLSKSRRKSCPHLPHLHHLSQPNPDDGSINSAFQPD